MSAEPTTKQAPNLTATEVLEQARERLQEATSAQEVARELSEAARATLAELEAQADRGEAVDTDAYVRAKSDLTLKSRRTAALAAPVSEAQAAVDQAANATYMDQLRAKTKTLPNSERAKTRLLKAFEDYLSSVKAEDDAVKDLYREADKLPDFPAGRPGLPALESGFPCYATVFQGQVEMQGRLGWLQFEGQTIRRPNLRREAGNVTDHMVRRIDAYARENHV